MFQMCGFVLLALGVWTVNDKLFVDELLRNKLYTETTFIIIVTSNLIILLSSHDWSEQWEARQQTK